jgi:hypothetical protein
MNPPELMKTITPAGIESWNLLHSTGCVLRSTIEQSDDRRGLGRGEHSDRPRAIAESRRQARASARCRGGQVASDMESGIVRLFGKTECQSGSERLSGLW